MLQLYDKAYLVDTGRLSAACICHLRCWNKLNCGPQQCFHCEALFTFHDTTTCEAQRGENAGSPVPFRHESVILKPTCADNRNLTCDVMPHPSVASKSFCTEGVGSIAVAATILGRASCTSQGSSSRCKKHSSSEELVIR